MNEDLGEQIWQSSLQNVGMYLLNLALGDCVLNGMEACCSGSLLHLRIKGNDGQVAVQVCGKDLDAVAIQLVLACLKKISIQQLRDLHKKPLKKPLQILTPT